MWEGYDQLSQTELYRELEHSFHGEYTLNQQIPNVTKLDEWIEDELTVFAVMIDDNPQSLYMNIPRQVTIH